MTEKKYDIFISYRSEDGAQYARILQLQLEKIGYRVFLDYDELKRDRFGDDITHAIQSAPIFLMILTPLYLERCLDEGNWIQREIHLAIEGNKHFVPVNPDRKYKGIPEGLSPQIADIVENYQHSIVDFGQTLKVTFDLMVRNQIKPIVKPSHRPWKVWNMAIAIVIIAVCVCLFAVFYHREDIKDEQKEQVEDLAKLRTELEHKYQHFHLYLSPNLSARQLNTIDEILSKMKQVRDELWISQFEFTVAQWYGIKDENCDESESNMPITNVSYGEIYDLIFTFNDMTNLTVALPSVEQWEDAARGGVNNEKTLYAGNDDANEVAWYKDNSGGYAHASDGQQGKAPNFLDIYDMSGNVSELCNTAFYPQTDNSSYTVCGGNYTSPASEVTIASRMPFDNNAKADTVGFRIIVLNSQEITQ